MWCGTNFEVFPLITPLPSGAPLQQCPRKKGTGGAEVGRLLEYVATKLTPRPAFAPLLSDITCRPGREEIARGTRSVSDVNSTWARATSLHCRRVYLTARIYSVKLALRSLQYKRSGFFERRSLRLRTTPPQKAICYATSLPPPRMPRAFPSHPLRLL